MKMETVRELEKLNVQDLQTKAKEIKWKIRNAKDKGNKKELEEFFCYVQRELNFRNVLQGQE